MVRVPSIQQVTRDWKIGMLATPPLNCPLCGKMTRAKYACQWCKKEWNEEELDLRRQQRLAYYSQYDPRTRMALLERGYNDVGVP